MSQYPAEAEAVDNRAVNLAEARDIVVREGYQNFVLESDPRNVADAVVVQRVGDGWQTCVTDERAGKDEQSVKTFDSESDALQDFLRRLEATREYEEAMRALRAGHDHV